VLAALGQILASLLARAHYDSPHGRASHQPTRSTCNCQPHCGSNDDSNSRGMRAQVRSDPLAPRQTRGAHSNPLTGPQQISSNHHSSASQPSCETTSTRWSIPTAPQSYLGGAANTAANQISKPTAPNPCRRAYLFSLLAARRITKPPHSSTSLVISSFAVPGGPTLVYCMML